MLLRVSVISKFHYLHFRMEMFAGRTDVEAETPYLGHLLQRAGSLEKALKLGKTEGRRRRG